jgi:DNA-binding NarL/FixJ family response regulator
METCLICDDHAMMREALIGTVELGWPAARITHATDYPEAWEQIAAQPDLCITDLAMPGARPIDGIMRMREIAPGTAVLVITGSDDDKLLVKLFSLGIKGFIPKASKTSVLISAVQIVLAGETFVPSRILALTGYRPDVPPVASGTILPPRLTERQIAVLRLIGEGQSNKEIAIALAISPATVKAHAAAVIAILGAANRTDAAMRARQSGII